MAFLIQDFIDALDRRDEAVLAEYSALPRLTFEHVRRDNTAELLEMFGNPKEPWSPWIREITDRRPSAADVEPLKQAIMRYLDGGHGLFAASAIFSLGELADSDLHEYLVTQLERAYRAASLHLAALGQCLPVINVNYERCISGGSWSFDEFDKNMRDAQKFLRAKGRIGEFE